MVFRNQLHLFAYMTQALDCGLPEAKVQFYVQNTWILYIHHLIKSNDFHQFPLMYIIF